MTTATSETALEADRYLKEVAPHLDALPEDERIELLEDLAQHLREIAAEESGPLRERLGPPEAYAAELLASAGVASRGRARPPIVSRVMAHLDRLKRSLPGEELVRLMPVLRPAWWVGRAYLAVLLLGEVERGGSSGGIPIPHLAGNPALGVLGVALAIPLSVRLGQRGLGTAGRWAVIAGNVVLAFFALSLLGTGSSATTYYGPVDEEALSGVTGSCLENGDGQRITNLYAYDTEGRLLDPVLLYDQAGRPIDNLCPEYDDRGRRLSTEYRRDLNGAPVINAFPRRQSAFVRPEPPISRPGFADPDPTVPVSPPAVVVPRLATTTTTVPTTTTVATVPGG